MNHNSDNLPARKRKKFKGKKPRRINKNEAEMAKRRKTRRRRIKR